MYRILMIDDAPEQLDAHIFFLRSKGCVVKSASSVPQAMALLKQNVYDLLLLEPKMPGISGTDSCSVLHAAAQAPVIFLSNYAEEDDQLQGFALGAADYISKECGLDLFWARITACLNRRGIPCAMRSFPPLLLDLQRQKAFVGKSILPLTPTEFSLLSLISSHPGRIWSLEEIYRDLWGANGPVNVPMVQMHISRMRTKLNEAVPKHEFIVTVWGKGYQFIPPEADYL